MAYLVHHSTDKATSTLDKAATLARNTSLYIGLLYQLQDQYGTFIEGENSHYHLTLTSSV